MLDYLATTGTKDVKIAGDAGDEMLEQALAFRQTDPDLREQADQALAALAEDGTLAKISEEYFGADVSVKDGSRDVDVKGSDSRDRQVLKDTAWPMLGACSRARSR